MSDAVSIDYSVAELTVIDRIRLDPFERNGCADSIELVYSTMLNASPNQITY